VSGRSLVTEVLAAQLAIAAIIAVFAIVALAWTSGSVIRNNLAHWAGQWAEELNELGAPFYHDEREAVLGVERFVAKFPEIERVTWYRADGSALMSLGRSGVEREPGVPLAPQVQAELDAKAGVTPPFMLTENVDRTRFRLSGPIWTEAFAGDGLLASDPGAQKTQIALLGFVSIELDFSTYERALWPRLAGPGGGGVGAGAGAGALPLPARRSFRRRASPPGTSSGRPRSPGAPRRWRGHSCRGRRWTWTGRRRPSWSGCRASGPRSPAGSWTIATPMGRSARSMPWRG